MEYRQTKHSGNSYWSNIIYHGEEIDTTRATAATTYSDEQSVYAPDNAFDNNLETFYWTAGGTSYGAQWLQIYLPSPAILTSMDLTYNDTSYLDYSVNCSNDGSEWTSLGTFTHTNTQHEPQTWTDTISNTNSYLYYRLVFNETERDGRFWVKVYDWTLYSGGNKINTGLS